MIVQPGFEVTVVEDIGQRSLVRHVREDGRDFDMWTSKHAFTTPMERGECDAPNARDEIRGCL